MNNNQQQEEKLFKRVTTIEDIESGKYNRYKMENVLNKSDEQESTTLAKQQDLINQPREQRIREAFNTYSIKMKSLKESILADKFVQKQLEKRRKEIELQRELQWDNRHHIGELPAYDIFRDKHAKLYIQNSPIFKKRVTRNDSKSSIDTSIISGNRRAVSSLVYMHPPGNKRENSSYYDSAVILVL